MIRTVRRLVALAACAGPLLLLSAGPAGADPNWQPVSKNNTFHCSTEEEMAFRVTVQTCVVVNGNAVQAVGIVDNKGFGAVSIEAQHVQLFDDDALIYDRHCVSSTLNPPFVRACFGPTLRRDCDVTMFAWVLFRIGDIRQFVRSPDRATCT